MFNSYCRQLLALPYLPSDDIRNAFDELAGEATTDAQRQLCTYIRATWLESTVWPPSTWSVFGCSVRSNNDVEGWHRRLNAKAQHGQLNLYLLLSLLASEAAIVNVTVTAMKESAVVRYQRVSSRKTTARLHRVWDRLRSNERSVRQTLRAASHVVATFGH